MRNLVFRGKTIPLGGYSLGGNAKGYRYVCSTCGELWGAVEIAEKGNYIVSSWPCEKHGNRFCRGGSFLSRVGWGDFSAAYSLDKTLERISPELVLHEALMAINQVIGPENA